MSGQWHPGTDAIADFQAGLVSGLRGRRLAAHIAGCARCASVRDELSGVSLVLASAPAPSLPDAVENRITAALAAEVTARERAASPAAAVAGQDSPDQVVPEHRSRSAQPARAPEAPRPPRRQRHRLRPAMALVPVAACLLAGFGYLLTNVGGSSTQSSAENAAAPAVTSGASAPVLSPARNAISQPLERASFIVTASGVNYQQATLSTQVRAELVAQQHHVPAEVPEPSATPAASGAEFGTPSGASATGNAAGSVPSRALVGCVLHLTGGARPSLVDRAAYQGKPAYVIAVPGEAWVVGLGCTASEPDVITSVSLATAP